MRDQGGQDDLKVGREGGHAAAGTCAHDEREECALAALPGGHTHGSVDMPSERKSAGEGGDPVLRVLGRCLLCAAVLPRVLG